MSDTPKKRARVLSSFTDAGTGESYQKGATPLIDAGAFANYQAAGLVDAPPAASPAKSSPKRKARPKSAKPAPAPAPVPAEPSAQDKDGADT